MKQSRNKKNKMEQIYFFKREKIEKTNKKTF